MQERVLFVHAHPDDESISTGGTIATLVARGAHVTVVTCTRGERGEVIEPSLKNLEGNGAALAEVRTAELRSALAVLGVTDHRFLGDVGARSPQNDLRRYTDSGMRWGVTPTGVPTAVAAETSEESSLFAADPFDLLYDLDAVIVDVAPTIIVSYDENGGYGHPDHIRAHQISRASAHDRGIPFYVIEPGSEPAIAVDVSAVLDRKKDALRAYTTQLVVRGEEFVSPGGQVESISSIERFRRVRPPSTGDWKGSSLFTRIATCVLALLVGALTGAILTVSHQASILLGSVVVPWGIIAAVIVTAALLTGLRIVFETRIVAGCAALGLLGVAAFLALQSAGGSILVPSNVIGYVWTFAPVVIAGVVLAWPRINPASRGTIKVPAAKGPDPL